MEDTILYCELLTHEEVEEFNTLMVVVIPRAECYYPAFYVQHSPEWIREGRPRGENEDPLAAIILKICHTHAQYSLTAGYRCVEGTKVEPEIMKNIILALRYTETDFI